MASPSAPPGEFAFRLRRKPDHGGADLHVIVEHHSTIDPCMVVRTLLYKALLLERLVDHRNALHTGVLQVLVLVLCHGARPWKAPLKVGRMRCLWRMIRSQKGFATCNFWSIRHDGRRAGWGRHWRFPGRRCG